MITLLLSSTNSALHEPHGFILHLALGWAGHVFHWQKSRRQVNMGLPGGHTEHRNMVDDHGHDSHDDDNYQINELLMRCLQKKSRPRRDL